MQTYMQHLCTGFTLPLPSQGTSATAPPPCSRHGALNGDEPIHRADVTELTVTCFTAHTFNATWRNHNADQVMSKMQHANRQPAIPNVSHQRKDRTSNCIADVMRKRTACLAPGLQAHASSSHMMQEQGHSCMICTRRRLDVWHVHRYVRFKHHRDALPVVRI